MESDACYRKGEHLTCLGCSCTCHPRPGRKPERVKGELTRTGPCAVTWHPGQDEMWAL